MNSTDSGIITDLTIEVIAYDTDGNEIDAPDAAIAEARATIQEILDGIDLRITIHQDGTWEIAA